jgi:hypothetical protein
VSSCAHSPSWLDLLEEWFSSMLSAWYCTSAPIVWQVLMRVLKRNVLSESPLLLQRLVTGGGPVTAHS